MTRRQAERGADVLDHLAVAITLGAGGDLVVLNTRTALDIGGLVFAFALFAASQKLTRQLGGPRL